MTSLIRVHALLSGLIGQRHSKDSNKTRLPDMLSIIIDPMIRYLDLGHIALLARSCRSLRVLTSDDQLLYFLLQYIPSKNSQDTRRRFLIPRKVELHRVGQCRYSQQHAFVYAMNAHAGLKGFRLAVVKRRALIDRRRERIKIRQATAFANANRRRQLVIDAMEVVGLPQTFMQIRVHTIRFIHITPPTTPNNEAILLGLLIEHLCWRYYLREYTDFQDRVTQRVELMGWYPGLASDIEDEFVRPLVWPWLE
jgi:hypothetical protein